MLSPARFFVKRIYVNGLIRRMEHSNPDKSWPIAAVCQMNSKNDKKANFERVEMLLRKAKKCGASMAFLPECFDFVGDHPEQTMALAETLDGDIINSYKNFAKTQKMWLSLGGFHEKVANESRCYNSHIIIDETGNIAYIYRKIHLYDVDIPNRITLKESHFSRPGPKLGEPVECPLGQLGCLICYDLRFAEESILLRKNGANILTFPSAFTVETGMSHWECLLRARAIETQSYVIAAAQSGKHNSKRCSFGHSMIVDPWGVIVAQCTDEYDVAIAEINIDRVNMIRERMPVLSHRRYDLYSLEPVVDKLKHFSMKNNEGTKSGSHKCLEKSQSGSYGKPEAYLFGPHVIPSSCVFYESKYSFAFVNLKPLVNCHVLVSTKRVLPRFTDLSSEEISDLFKTAQLVQKTVESQTGCHSSTISIQDGPEAGQTVNHIHVHVLPRKAGDFKHNDQIYENLDGADAHLRIARSEEEMAYEAGILRNIINKLASNNAQLLPNMPAEKQSSLGVSNQKT